MLTVSMMSGLFAKADTWDGVTTDKSWYDAEKTEFHIESASQLKGLADLVNDDKISFENCRVYLDADVDLGYNQWTPIGFGNAGFYNSVFKGDFNGQGFEISNMRIKCSALPYGGRYDTVGLFGNMSGKVSNLNLRGLIIIDNEEYRDGNAYVVCVGGICAAGSGTLNDCFCDININSEMDLATMSSFYIGGAVGMAQSVSNLKTIGSIYLNYGYGFGGRLGSVACEVSDVKECESTVDIQSRVYDSTNGVVIGGIVSRCDNIQNCIYKGNWQVIGVVPLRNGYIGGIAGIASESVEKVIFSPKSCVTNVEYDYIWAYSNFVGPISPSVGGATVVNSYYTNNLSVENPSGVEMSESELMSGTMLPDFSLDIWTFPKGRLPFLTALARDYTISVPTENGYIGMLVEEGNTTKIKLIPDEGWIVDSFYVDGVDMTWALDGNLYTFENVDRNHAVTVVYRKNPASIDVIQCTENRCKIVVNGNVVTITNLFGNNTIIVAGIDGKIENVYKTDASTYDVYLNKGVHIIRIGDSSFKFII